MRDLIKDTLLMRKRREKGQHPAGFKPRPLWHEACALPLCYNHCHPEGPWYLGPGGQAANNGSVTFSQLEKLKYCFLLCHFQKQYLWKHSSPSQWSTYYWKGLNLGRRAHSNQGRKKCPYPLARQHLFHGWSYCQLCSSNFSGFFCELQLLKWYPIGPL